MRALFTEWRAEISCSGLEFKTTVKVRMIRIIVDSSHTTHGDLYLKIDVLPTYSKKGDSYYLFDFLEINEEELENGKIDNERVLSYAVLKLIDYWSGRIQNLRDGDKIFLPFDFQDEYIGGLLLTKSNLDFKIKVVYSDKIHSYEVNKSIFDQVLFERQIKFVDEENAEWNVSHSQLFEGLEWSRNELTE